MITDITMLTISTKDDMIQIAPSLQMDRYKYTCCTKSSRSPPEGTVYLYLLPFSLL